MQSDPHLFCHLRLVVHPVAAPIPDYQKADAGDALLPPPERRPERHRDDEHGQGDQDDCIGAGVIEVARAVHHFFGLGERGIHNLQSESRPVHICTYCGRR